MIDFPTYKEFMKMVKSKPDKSFLIERESQSTRMMLLKPATEKLLVAYFGALSYNETIERPCTPKNYDYMCEWLEDQADTVLNDHYYAKWDYKLTEVEDE